MIYEELLIVPYAVPRLLYRHELPENFKPIKLNAAILRVSKQVYAEAVPVLYTKNCFTTERYYSFIFFGNDTTTDPAIVKLPHYGVLNTSPEPPLRNFLTNRPYLAQDVSKIFTKYRTRLPKWLFGAAYVRNPKTWRLVKRPKVPGYYFIRFLRRIGSRNANQIKSIQICTSSDHTTRRFRDELALYLEIIRQHLHEVRDLRLSTYDFSLFILGAFHVLPNVGINESNNVQ